MSEDRESVDEIELLVLIVQLSCKSVGLKLSEGQMFLTPLNQLGIIVRAVHFWPTQAFPLTDHTSNATAKVENCIEGFEFNAIPFEHVPDLLCRDFTCAEKDIRAAMLCNHVDQITRRKRRSPQSMTKPVRPKRNVL